MIGLIVLAISSFFSGAVGVIVEHITHAGRSATWGSFYRSILAFSAFGISWSVIWIIAKQPNRGDDVNLGAWFVSLTMVTNMLESLRFAAKQRKIIQQG